MFSYTFTYFYYATVYFSPPKASSIQFPGLVICFPHVSRLNPIFTRMSLGGRRLLVRLPATPCPATCQEPGASGSSQGGATPPGAMSQWSIRVLYWVLFFGAYYMIYIYICIVIFNWYFVGTHESYSGGVSGWRDGFRHLGAASQRFFGGYPWMIFQHKIGNLGPNRDLGI
jgi:hypothetical protein